MRVFLSWSGERSKRVATRLRAWLADVMPVNVQPWMSDADIGAGKRWGRELDAQLADSKYGVVCLTGANQLAPWLLFEAGALAKSVSEANVCPYLIDLEAKDVVAGPLTQFQAVRANEQGTWDLVRSINSALEATAFDEAWLRKHFERWWPDLAADLARLPLDGDGAPRHRSTDEMLSEVLQISRRLDTIEMPEGGWIGLYEQLSRIQHSIAALQRTQYAERSSSRATRRQFRLNLEYQRTGGGLGTLLISIDSEHTIFDALTTIWHRLRNSDAAVKPPAYTYLWDWVLIRGDGRPLVAGGLVHSLPAAVIFESEPRWSVEALEKPLLNDADWLAIERGQPQV